MASETEAHGDDPVAALAARLLDAARQGDTATLVAYVDAGAPVDLTGDTGDTLVMLASYHGHAATVNELLRRGADPNLANERGQTPLGGAAFKGHVEVIDALVAAGADPDGGEPSARATLRALGRDDLVAHLPPPVT